MKWVAVLFLAAAVSADCGPDAYNYGLRFATEGCAELASLRGQQSFLDFVNCKKGKDTDVLGLLKGCAPELGITEDLSNIENAYQRVCIINDAQTRAKLVCCAITKAFTDKQQTLNDQIQEDTDCLKGIREGK